MNDDKHPSEQKSRERAEGIAQIHVDPTGPRIRGAQLAEGERAEHRQCAAGDPRQQGGKNVPVHLSEHGARHEEDPRTDHGADDQQREIAKAERARQSLVQDPYLQR